MTQRSHTSEFYLISDAVGQLTVDLLKSVAVQFPGINIKTTTYPFVQHEDNLLPILEKAKQTGAHIVATFVKKELDQLANDYCQKNGIYYNNVLHPLIQ